MSIKVTCEECFSDYTVKDQFAGRKIKCKECGAAIRIPATRQFEEDDTFDDNSYAEQEFPRKRPPKKRNVSKKEKPARKKYNGGGVPAAGIAGGAGTLLVIVLVVIVKTGLLQNLVLSRVNWTPYTTPDGNLTVLVTGKVKEKKMPVDPNIVKQRIDIVDHHQFGCAITSIELKDSVANPITGKPLSPTGIKIYLLPGVLQMIPGSRQLETSESSFSGVPALLAKLEVPLPNGKKAINNLGIISIDKYLYSVEFITTKGKPREKDKKKFFDSIKLSDTLVQKYNELKGGLAPAALAKQAPNNRPQNNAIPDTPNIDINVSPMNNPLVKSTPSHLSKPVASKAVKEIPKKKISWSVKPDPLPEQPEWEMAKKVEINLPDMTKEIYRPDPFGPTLLCRASFRTPGALAIFSLATGKRESLFQGSPRRPPKRCFSPDAKLMGTHQTNTEAIDIWDLKSGELIHKLAFTRNRNEGTGIHQLHFTDPDHVLIMQWQNPDIKISDYSIYDLSQKAETLSPVRKFSAQTMAYRSDLINSPGNRYTAGVSHDRKGAYIIDWEKGKFAGELNIPGSSERGNAFYVKGLGFSPDGKYISVLGEATDETTVFGISTSTGKLEWEHHWDRSLKLLIPGSDDDSVDKPGHALNWLADSTAFSLRGRMLVDAKTGKTLWFMESYHDKEHNILHNNRPFYLTSQGMLSTESNGRKMQLQLKKFSPENLQKSLALLDQPDQAKIAPGSSVALDIKIDKVLHVKKDQAMKEVTELLTEKLEKEGFTVADEADYVLHVDYREVPGEEWTSRNGKGKFPSIKMQYRIQWLPQGKKKELWEVENDFIPFSVYFRDKEVTALMIRDKIFEQFKDHLLGRPIVYLIPKDEELPMLPQFDSTHY